MRKSLVPDGARLLSAVVAMVAALSYGVPLAGAAPIVKLYGAPGTFAGLADHPTLPGGQSFASVPVAGWGFLPGQAAYFTAVGPGGTVFVANEPQTDNQLEPTAREMAISTFDPSTERFQNIVIPTSTGADEVAGPWPSPTLRVGGADIADLAATSIDGSPRIAFISAMPYEGWSIAQRGVYPTLGYLADAPEGWSYDASESVDALAITRSATARSGQPCLQETNFEGQPFADCRLPAQMSVLPASRDIVVTQYAGDGADATSGGLMVLDPRGRVLATYHYPRIALPHGTVVSVDPREVDADPTSPLGKERFVVVFDSYTGTGPSLRRGPFAMQEFSFDAASATITPRSAPVLTGDRAPDGAPLGFETAQYDSAGDLWAAQSENGTLTGGALAIYDRAADGATLARPGCGVGDEWSGGGWGTPCAPDAEIDRTAPLGIVRSLNQDPDTHAMLVATMSGALLPVLTTGDPAHPYSVLKPIDLGLNGLAHRNSVAIDLRQGAIDPTTDTLWLPVQQLLTGAECPLYPCAPTALSQWLYAIDLRPILGRARRDHRGSRARGLRKKRRRFLD